MAKQKTTTVKKATVKKPAIKISKKIFDDDVQKLLSKHFKVKPTDENLINLARTHHDEILKNCKEQEGILGNKLGTDER
jgi:hypothetical protein